MSCHDDSMTTTSRSNRPPVWQVPLQLHRIRFPDMVSIISCGAGAESEGWEIGLPETRRARDTRLGSKAFCQITVWSWARRMWC
jgi:hypothetical protein